MPKLSNKKKTATAKVRKNRMGSNATYNIARADPTFGISSIVSSYKIDLAHAMYRSVLQPTFNENALSGKMRTMNFMCTKTQMYLQTYCLQQLVLTGMAQHILTMVMKLAHRKAKPMSMNMHEMMMDAFNAIRKSGGAKNKSMGSAIKKPLVFLLLLFSCISATTGYAGKLQMVNTQFSDVSTSMETVSMQLYEMKQTESVAVSVKNVIDRHDKKIDEQISGIGKAIYYLFHSLPESGESQIIKYVEEFNDLMHGLSKNATKECRKIVDDAYEQGMFANYKSREQIDALEREYAMLVEMKKQNKEDTTIGLKQTVASAAAAAISGDIFTPFAMMYKTVESVVNKPQDKLDAAEINMTNEVGITSEQLWSTSKVYCANSFHLELEYSESDQTLRLLGDKIGYESMREFTSSVVMNMKSAQKTTATNADNSAIFRSMEQRMKTLEYIVNHLENMVTMGMMNELVMQTRARSSNPIAKIRAYFDEQNAVIHSAVSTMSEMFPIDARIAREQLLATQEMSRLSSENTRENVRVASEYYSDMIHSYSNLIRKPLSAVVTNFAATVLDIPTDMIEVTTVKLSAMVTNMMGIMMQSSGGIVLMAFGFMTFMMLASIALQPIRAVGNILYLPIAGLIWVVKSVFKLGSPVVYSAGVVGNAHSENMLIADAGLTVPARKTRKNEQKRIEL